MSENLSQMQTDVFCATGGVLLLQRVVRDATCLRCSGIGEHTEACPIAEAARRADSAAVKVAAVRDRLRAEIAERAAERFPSAPTVAWNGKWAIVIGDIGSAFLPPQRVPLSVEHDGDGRSMRVKVGDYGDEPKRYPMRSDGGFSYAKIADEVVSRASRQARLRAEALRNESVRRASMELAQHVVGNPDLAGVFSTAGGVAIGPADCADQVTVQIRNTYDEGIAVELVRAAKAAIVVEGLCRFLAAAECT